MDDQTITDALILIGLALVEDIGSTQIDQGVDCTTQSIVPEQALASAAFVARQEGVVCGVTVCQLAIETFSPKLKLRRRLNDGDRVRPGETIAVLSGLARQILVMERTCLNFMCRLSGISTLTDQYVKRVEGTVAKILDTRKTLPGWRRLEKYAVRCGGGTNHRMGLFDAVMIKDNHLAFYRTLVSDSDSTISSAVNRCREWIAKHKSSLPNGAQTILQVEVDSIKQLEIAIRSNPDIVLLDNMNPDQLSKAVTIRDEIAPRVELEASGGVNLQTVRKIAQTGVERISVGAVTHSALNFDIGLDWTTEQSAE